MSPSSGRAGLQLALLLTGAMIVAAGTFGSLYLEALDRERDIVADSVRAHAQVLEHLLAEHSGQSLDSLGSHHFRGGDDVFHDAAHGQFLAAQRQGDEVLILSWRSGPEDRLQSRGTMETLPEPMRRALAGESGTVIAADHRGVMVIAAFHPIADGDTGLVLQEDLAEFSAPFVRTAAIGVLGVLSLLGLAGLLMNRTGHEWRIRFRRQEMKQAVAFASVQEGIVAFDVRSICTAINAAALAKLGLRHERDALGRPMGLLFNAASHSRTPGSRGGESGGTGRATLLRPDGTSFVADWRSSTLLDGEKVIGRVISFRDMTDLTKAEEAIVRATRDAERISRLTADLLTIDGPAGICESAAAAVHDLLEGVAVAVSLSDALGRWEVVADSPRLEEFARGWEVSTEILRVAVRNAGELSGYIVVETRSDVDTARARQVLGRIAAVLGLAAEKARVRGELRDSEQRYRSMLHDHADMVCCTLPDGTITFVNNLLSEAVGLPARDLIGRNYATFVPNGSEHIAERLSRLSPRTPSYTTEHEVVLPDGTVRWHQWSNRGIFDESGSLVEVQAAGRDITERKAMERDLLLRGKVLDAVAFTTARLLQDADWRMTLPDVLRSIGIALEASHVYVYQAVSENLALHVVDEWYADGFLPVASSPGLAVVEPDEMGVGTEARRLALGQTVSLRTNDLTGALRPLLEEHGVTTLLVVPIFSDHDWWGLIGIIARSDEWSDPVREGLRGVANALGSAIRRHRSEEALRISERRLRALTESIPDALVSIDKQGTILSWNDGATSVFGYDSGTMLGQPFRSLFPRESALPDLVLERCCDLNEDHVGRTGFALRRDGEAFPTEVTIGCWDEFDHQILSVILKDISKRQELERQLTQARQVEALGSLAGGIAHNFNNLLMPMVSLTDIVMNDFPEGDRRREMLAKVLEAGEKATELVGRILSFSRGGSHRPEQECLEDVLARSVDFLRSVVPSTVRLEADIAPVGTAWLDEAQIQTVLLNVVGNAVQAFDGGSGTITISLEHSSGRLLSPHPAQNQMSYGRIRVADDGPGMPPDVAERVFEPFFTTKEVGVGTGLGLSTAYEIVSRHGGSITLHSTPAQGTEFLIDLPLVHR